MLGGSNGVMGHTFWGSRLGKHAAARRLQLVLCTLLRKSLELWVLQAVALRLAAGQRC